MVPLLIGQITDMHVRAGRARSNTVVDTAGFLEQCVARVLALPQRPDCILFTGDLVDAGTAADYAFLRELLAPLSMPYYLVPGNHDDRDQLRASFPGHAYLREWPPFVQYAIEDWPLRIVALDTVVTGEARGLLCERRLAWLEETLARAPGRPTLLAMHHPPFTTFIDHMDRVGLEGADVLAGVLRRHPQVERVVCGHLHRPIQSRFAGTVASTCASAAHQVTLDLAPGAAESFMLEPPAFQLHAWTPATGVVSHTVVIGQFPGPYPFTD